MCYTPTNRTECVRGRTPRKVYTYVYMFTLSMSCIHERCIHIYIIIYIYNIYNIIYIIYIYKWVCAIHPRTRQNDVYIYIHTRCIHIYIHIECVLYICTQTRRNAYGAAHLARCASHRVHITHTQSMIYTTQHSVFMTCIAHECVPIHRHFRMLSIQRHEMSLYGHTSWIHYEHVMNTLWHVMNTLWVCVHTPTFPNAVSKLDAQSSNVSFHRNVAKETFELWALSFQKWHPRWDSLYSTHVIRLSCVLIIFFLKYV